MRTPTISLKVGQADIAGTKVARKYSCQKSLMESESNQTSKAKLHF